MTRIERSDDGIGMLLVLGIATTMFLIVALAVSITDGSVNSSQTHVRREQALQVAEHGIDQVLARVQANKSYVTTANTPPVAMTEAEERAWASTRLATASVEATPNGEFAIVKPTGRNVVYSAGWVPNRASAKNTRYLKAEYLFSTFSPDNALLTDGSLGISGNPTISGAQGNVHANGNLTLNGGSMTITGTATASGTISNPHNAGATGSGGAKPAQPVPAVEPGEIYLQLSSTYAASWHDLCPDATVRRPGSTPCSGTIIGNTASGDPSYGWKLSGGTWQKENPDIDGVFYVFQNNAKVSGNPGTSANPWQATVITEGNAPTSGCQRPNGDLEMSGNPTFTSFIPGLALVAGRDLKINGNFEYVGAQALFAAQDQVGISGNPTLLGAVIGEDRCEGTNGSAIDIDAVSGNPKIKYDGGLDSPLGGIIRTTLWLEQ